MRLYTHLLILMLISIPLETNAQHTMDENAKIPIQRYFEGTAKGNIELLKAAFHPDCNIYFTDQKKQLAFYTQSEFFDLVRQHHGKAERINKLISIDVSGTIAMAKTRSDFPTFYFIDYLMLLKIGDSWKIISKSTTTYEK